MTTKRVRGGLHSCTSINNLNNLHAISIIKHDQMFLVYFINELWDMILQNSNNSSVVLQTKHQSFMAFMLWPYNCSTNYLYIKVYISTITLSRIQIRT